MPSPFSFVNFLHSGAGGQQFSPFNVSAQQGQQPGGQLGGQLGGQAPGQQPASTQNVDRLRALLLAGIAPQRLRGPQIAQSDPLASMPGINFLARMRPGFEGGGGQGGPGGRG